MVVRVELRHAEHSIAGVARGLLAVHRSTVCCPIVRNGRERPGREAHYSAQAGKLKRLKRTN